MQEREPLQPDRPLDLIDQPLGRVRLVKVPARAAQVRRVQRHQETLGPSHALDQVTKLLQPRSQDPSGTGAVLQNEPHLRRGARQYVHQDRGDLPGHVSVAATAVTADVGNHAARVPLGAGPQRRRQRRRRPLNKRRIGRGEVDQVDGVDKQRVDGESAARGDEFAGALRVQDG